MRPVTTLSFVAVVTFTCLSFSFRTDNGKVGETIAGKGFAVVELFTSEGCSACPPADEAVIKMAKEFPDRVYILSYHVDYWNYIGWNDPFSQAAFSGRQRKYSDLFGLNSMYTPQAVVNGKKQLVASKESLLRATIQNELRDSAHSGIVIQGVQVKEGNVRVSCKVINGAGSLLNIALIRSQAVTNVKRGENSGRTLEHINVVVELKSIPVRNDEEITATFKIPSMLAAKEVKLISFVQDKKSLIISGAAAVPVE